MHSGGFDFERNHGPNRGVDSFRQGGADMGKPMIKADGSDHQRYEPVEGGRASGRP